MITNPIQFTGNELVLVTAYNNNPNKDPNYWTSDEIAGVRSSVKRHYEQEQGFRCSYCNMLLLTKHGSVWNGEHVVSRSTHPQLMFEPKNLVATCVDCNTTKSNKPTLANHARTTLPNDSAGFLILNPHFDDFDDHIIILIERFYIPKTRKGEATIQTCGLLRYAYRYLEWNETVSEVPEFDAYVQQLMGAATQQERQHAMLQILAICQIKALLP